MSAKIYLANTCGCRIVTRGTEPYEIQHCSLHQAAPQLLHLLGLIVAEFKSDPMSVQCFDLDAIVEPAKALVDELEGKS